MKDALQQNCRAYNDCNFNNYGGYKDLNKSGRPMKTSTGDDRMIKQIAIRFPTSSFKDIHATLLRKGTDIHISKIFRRLRFQFGLKSYKLGSLL